jgi:hypothetical protein
MSELIVGTMMLALVGVPSSVVSSSGPYDGSIVPPSLIVVVGNEAVPVYGQRLSSPLSNCVPVVSITPDGAVRDGVWLPAQTGSARVEQAAPIAITWSDMTNEWLIEMAWSHRTHCGGYCPEEMIPSSDCVTVHNGSIQQRHERDMLIDFSFEAANVPPSTGTADNVSLVSKAIQRVRRRVLTIFDEEVTSTRNLRVDVVILFDPALTIPGSTVVLEVEKPYSVVYNDLTTLHADSLPDSFEQNIYAAMPIGSSLPSVIGPSGMNASVSTIRVPWSLDNKWNGIVHTPVTIKIRQDSGWDFDPKNGIGSGLLDFEAVLTHELFHVFGFISHVDSSTNYGQMTLLDMFRFDGGIVGATVSGTEILSSRRPIVPTATAVMSLDINSTTFTVPMSTGVAAPGDGAQAEHWKNRITSLLGVMDPSVQTGRFELSPKYVTAFDVRALDLIGWDVLLPVVVNGLKVPDIALLQSPSDGELDVSLSPTLTWQNPNTDPDMQLATVYVAEVSESYDNAVYAVDDVNAEFITIPSGVLTPNKSYRWAVIINGDSTWSELAEFQFTTTSECIADYDENGEVDILDFLAFLDDFSVCDGMPAPCGATSNTDVNGDTIVDILDFLDFLDSFSVGCGG